MPDGSSSDAPVTRPGPSARAYTRQLDQIPALSSGGCRSCRVRPVWDDCVTATVSLYARLTSSTTTMMTRIKTSVPTPMYMESSSCGLRGVRRAPPSPVPEPTGTSPRADRGLAPR